MFDCKTDSLADEGAYGGPVEPLPFADEIRKECDTAQGLGHFNEAFLRRIVDNELRGIAFDEGEAIPSFETPEGDRMAIRFLSYDGVWCWLVLPEYRDGKRVSGVVLYYEGDREPDAEMLRKSMDAIALIVHAEAPFAK